MVAKVVENAEEVIIGVYRTNLHCPECASKIKKPLLRTQGVQSVEYDTEKNEIKVKGDIDVTKIHKRIESLSKKKVELISPQPQSAKINKEKEIVVVTTQTKKKTIRTTSMKVHLHCEKCELDLKNKLLRHPGIHTVKTDYKSQSVIVEGFIEEDKLLAFMRKKVHKHAEIISSTEKEKKAPPNANKEEKKAPPKDKSPIEIVKTSTTDVIEFKEEVKIVEAKTKDTVTPYFIHYVYSPQLFSDENPNACHIL